MKNFKVFIFAAFVAIVFSAVCEQASFADISVEKDILYCEADGFKLLGDMYVPDGDGPFPGILFVHGGGFVGGDKAYGEQPAHLAKHAERGYVVFSINYRLFTDGVAFQGSIEDTKCGLAWFRAHADDYKADPDNLAVMGFSAGGYFAAMIAFTQNDPRFQPATQEFKDADTSVTAAILFYPPGNLVTYKSNLTTMLEMEMMKTAGIKSKKELKIFKRKYSPIFYIKEPPPIFLGYALNDGLVPPYQQDQLMVALDKAGATYEHFMATQPEADHGFITMKPELEDTQEAEKRMFSFIDKYLKPAE